MPRGGASDDYPIYMFSSGNKRTISHYMIISIPISAKAMKSLLQDNKLKFPTFCPQENRISWTSRAWYFHSPDKMHLVSKA